jgi:peptidoglycan/LPS O-acetylase OafA/YrhL
MLKQPLSFTDVISVLTITQSWTPPSSGHGYLWVMQAWTLSVEAVFYLAFPLIWPALARIGPRGAMVMASACAALIVAVGAPSIAPGVSSIPFVGAETPLLLPVFRMAEFGYGVALCQLYLMRPQGRHRIHRDVAEIALASSMILVLMLATDSQTKGLFAVFAGLFIFIAAEGQGVLSRRLAGRAWVLLGGASYALYILQGPMRTWCAALINAPYDRFVSPPATLGLAIAVFLMVEQPARRWLMRRGDAVFPLKARGTYQTRGT